MRADRGGWEQVDYVLTAGFEFFVTNPEFACGWCGARPSTGGRISRSTSVRCSARSLTAVVAYFGREMERGTFRPHDPEQLLLTGYGALLSYFSDAPFLEGLLDHDPLDETSLKARLEHIRAFFRAARTPTSVRPPWEPSGLVTSMSRTAWRAPARRSSFSMGPRRRVSSWQLVTPLLSAVRTVVMPEFPGSGETVDAGGRLEVDDLVAQVLAVADDLGLERFHLGGWSLGGAIAVAVAAAAPARVESLLPVNVWSKTDARMKFTFDLWTQLIETDPQLFAA